MKPANRLVASVPMVLVALSQVTPALAEVRAGSQCLALRLPEPPKWISTLVWDTSRQGLLIADPAQERLLLYTPGDQRSQSIEISQHSPRSSSGPTSVSLAGGKIFVQFSDSSAGFLDDTQKVALTGPSWFDDSVDTSRPRAAGSVANLFTNWIEHRGQVLGYGAINALGFDPTKQTHSVSSPGVVLADFDARTGALSHGRTIDRTTPFDYYRLGYPYFAANDLGLHYVQMIPGKPATVLRVVAGVPKSVAVAPAPFDTVPILQSPTSNASSPLVVFTQRTVVAGLFGGPGDALFLLTREPVPGTPKTRWQVHKMNSKGTVVGVVTLPSSAVHLVIARAPDSWYLAERHGTGQTWGNQRIETILQLPASWIEDPEQSPLALNSGDGVRCEHRPSP